MGSSNGIKSNSIELGANYVHAGHGHPQPGVAIVLRDLSKDFGAAGAEHVIDFVGFTIDHPTTRQRVWDKLEQLAEARGATIDPKAQSTYAPKDPA